MLEETDVEDGEAESHMSEVSSTSLKFVSASLTGIGLTADTQFQIKGTSSHWFKVPIEFCADNLGLGYLHDLPSREHAVVYAFAEWSSQLHVAEGGRIRYPDSLHQKVIMYLNAATAKVGGPKPQGI